MNRLREWASRLKRNRNERGNTLIEVVTTVALYMIIGGAFVYASMVIIDARETSGEETASAITMSGMSNTFRDDIANATAVKVNDLKDVLTLARSDGTCVRWTIAKTPDSETSEAFRANAKNTAPKVQGAPFAEDIRQGSFSNVDGSVKVDLKFESGKTLNESVKLNLAGSDGGGCL